MAFDDYADNHSVPPKSCRPHAARENLPQSFHSLAVSEPDPITLFTLYIYSVLSLSNGCATKKHRHFQIPGSAKFPVKMRKSKFQRLLGTSTGGRFLPSGSYFFNTLQRSGDLFLYTNRFYLSSQPYTYAHSSPKEA